MATAKTANSKSHVSTARVRKIDGKVVRACLFNGRGGGHGIYFAGMIDNDLVLDATGRPVPFRQCGKLELV